MLELKGIYKSFGDTEVLKGVDVSVEEGDIVGIIGSSDLENPLFCGASIFWSMRMQDRWSWTVFPSM